MPSAFDKIQRVAQGFNMIAELVKEVPLCNAQMFGVHSVVQALTIFELHTSCKPEATKKLIAAIDAPTSHPLNPTKQNQFTTDYDTAVQCIERDMAALSESANNTGVVLPSADATRISELLRLGRTYFAASLTP